MRKTVVSLLLSCLPSLFCIGSAHAADDLLQVPACTVSSQSVRAAGYLPVNGIEQWVTIAGAACGNPVILFIHGGPGNALSPFSDAMYGAWQQHYTIVQWDQRGAGMTYTKNRPTDDVPLSIEQMRDDGLLVAGKVAALLGKDKLIMMGSSWGSILGVHMAKARPELFYAYIGTAQVVDARANLASMYGTVLGLARQAGDTATVAKLAALGAPPWRDPRNFGILRRADRHYEALVTEPAPKQWWQPAPQYATPALLADAEAADDYSYLQFMGLNGDGMFSRVDLAALGTDFRLPVFFLMGEADYLSSPALARRYFDAISAPKKGFVQIARAGHDPNVPTLEAQWKLLQEQVAPLLR